MQVNSQSSGSQMDSVERMPGLQYRDSLEEDSYGNKSQSKNSFKNTQNTQQSSSTLNLNDIVSGDQKLYQFEYETLQKINEQRLQQGQEPLEMYLNQAQFQQGQSHIQSLFNQYVNTRQEDHQDAQPYPQYDLRRKLFEQKNNQSESLERYLGQQNKEGTEDEDEDQDNQGQGREQHTYDDEENQYYDQGHINQSGIDELDDNDQQNYNQNQQNNQEDDNDDEEEGGDLQDNGNNTIGKNVLNQYLQKYQEKGQVIPQPDQENDDEEEEDDEVEKQEEQEEFFEQQNHQYQQEGVEYLITELFEGDEKVSQFPNSKENNVKEGVNQSQSHTPSSAQLQQSSLKQSIQFQEHDAKTNKMSEYDSQYQFPVQINPHLYSSTQNIKKLQSNQNSDETKKQQQMRESNNSQASSSNQNLSQQQYSLRYSNHLPQEENKISTLQRESDYQYNSQSSQHQSMNQQVRQSNNIFQNESKRSGLIESNYQNEPEKQIISNSHQNQNENQFRQQNYQLQQKSEQQQHDQISNQHQLQQQDNYRQNNYQQKSYKNQHSSNNRELDQFERKLPSSTSLNQAHFVQSEQSNPENRGYKSNEVTSPQSQQQNNGNEMTHEQQVMQNEKIQDDQYTYRSKESIDLTKRSNFSNGSATQVAQKQLYLLNLLEQKEQLNTDRFNRLIKDEDIIEQELGSNRTDVRVNSEDYRQLKLLITSKTSSQQQQQQQQYEDNNNNNNNKHLRLEDNLYNQQQQQSQLQKQSLSLQSQLTPENREKQLSSITGNNTKELFEYSNSSTKFVTNNLFDSQPRIVKDYYDSTLKSRLKVDLFKKLTDPSILPQNPVTQDNKIQDFTKKQNEETNNQIPHENKKQNADVHQICFYSEISPIDKGARHQRDKYYYTEDNNINNKNNKEEQQHNKQSQSPTINNPSNYNQITFQNNYQFQSDSNFKESITSDNNSHRTPINQIKKSVFQQPSQDSNQQQKNIPNFFKQSRDVPSTIQAVLYPNQMNKVSQHEQTQHQQPNYNILQQRRLESDNDQQDKSYQNHRIQEQQKNENKGQINKYNVSQEIFDKYIRQRRPNQYQMNDQQENEIQGEGDENDHDQLQNQFDSYNNQIQKMDEMNSNDYNIAKYQRKIASYQPDFVQRLHEYQHMSDRKKKEQDEIDLTEQQIMDNHFQQRSPQQRQPKENSFATTHALMKGINLHKINQTIRNSIKKNVNSSKNGNKKSIDQMNASMRQTNTSNSIIQNYKRDSTMSSPQKNYLNSNSNRNDLKIRNEMIINNLNYSPSSEIDNLNSSSNEKPYFNSTQNQIQSIIHRNKRQLFGDNQQSENQKRTELNISSPNEKKHNSCSQCQTCQQSLPQSYQQGNKQEKEQQRQTKNNDNQLNNDNFNSFMINRTNQDQYQQNQLIDFKMSDITSPISQIKSNARSPMKLDSLGNSPMKLCSHLNSPLDKSLECTTKTRNFVFDPSRFNGYDYKYIPKNKKQQHNKSLSMNMNITNTSDVHPFNLEDIEKQCIQHIQNQQYDQAQHLLSQIESFIYQNFLPNHPQRIYVNYLNARVQQGLGQSGTAVKYCERGLKEIVKEELFASPYLYKYAFTLRQLAQSECKKLQQNQQQRFYLTQMEEQLSYCESNFQLLDIEIAKIYSEYNAKFGIQIYRELAKVNQDLKDYHNACKNIKILQSKLTHMQYNLLLFLITADPRQLGSILLSKKFNFLVILHPPKIGCQYKETLIQENLEDIDLTVSLIDMLQLSNQKDEAVEELKKIIKFLRTIDSDSVKREEILIQCIDNLGNIYFENKEYELSSDYFEQSLQIKAHIYGQSHLITGVGYFLCGKTHHKLGNNQKASQRLNSSISILDKHLGQFNLYSANGILTLAEVAKQEQRLDDALKNYKCALERFSSIFGSGHFNCLCILLNLIFLTCQFSQPISQIQLFFQQIIKCTENKISLDSVQVLNEMSNILRQNNYIQQSLDGYLIAINILNKLKTSTGENADQQVNQNLFLIYMNLASTYTIQLAHQKAIHAYQDALKLTSSMQQAAEYQYKIHNHIAHSLQIIHKNSDASFHYQEALNILSTREGFNNEKNELRQSIRSCKQN